MPDTDYYLYAVQMLIIQLTSPKNGISHVRYRIEHVTTSSPLRRNIFDVEVSILSVYAIG